MATDALSRIRERISTKLAGVGGAGVYSGETPDILTRYMGGHYRNNQPFVTGYHQILFELPNYLFNATHNDSARKWFTSTCETFTPHTVTVNFSDVMGIGQIGATFMTNKTIGREFTLGFREYQHLPIMSFLDLWHSVFDEHSGASPLAGNAYVPSAYKGACTVFQLKPTGARENKLTVDDVEEIYVYQGVWPKTNPRDTVGASDQTTNDFIQLSVTFSFDGAPLTLSHLGNGNEVVNLIEKVNSLGSYSQTFTNAFNAATQQS